MKTYGRRSMGNHRRMTSEGPRPLKEEEFVTDIKTKVIANPTSSVVSAHRQAELKQVEARRAEAAYNLALADTDELFQDLKPIVEEFASRETRFRQEISELAAQTAVTDPTVVPCKHLCPQKGKARRENLLPGSTPILIPAERRNR